MERSHVLAWSVLLVGCSSSHAVEGFTRAASLAEGRGDAPAAQGSQSSGDGDEGPAPVLGVAEPLFYRDVKPIIDAKCAQCHRDGGIGPLPLTSYEEVTRVAQLVKVDVEAGIMPPWRASGPLDRYIGDRRLTEAQKQTIVNWVNQGAKAGDPDDEPEPLPTAMRGLPRVDLSLEMPEAFTPDVDPDTYRCFVMEWPEEEPTFVTGLGIEPDQEQMVHHAIVYLSGPESAERMRQQDEAAEGPGFPCAGPGTFGSWLTSYEPGGFPQELPDGLGLEVEPGSVIVLQMHYNTLKEKTADQSRVDFMLADQVERPARVQLFLNTLWAVGFMPIPANDEDVMHRYQGRPLGLSGAFDIYAVDLHMHTLGSRGSIGIIRQGGEDVSLLDIPDWAFEWQETYRFREPVRLGPADELYVECHWDNTADNQQLIDGQRLAPRDVNWGDGTTDEMCLGNVLITPAQ